MTDTIKPFVYRDSREAWLPSDITERLGEPSHVRQGEIIVFAVSPQAAWKRLVNLGLERRVRAHRLKEATDHMARAIATASVPGLVQDGHVFIFSSRGGRRPVVCIQRNEHDRRIFYIAGEIEPWEGRYRWVNRWDVTDDLTSDVTDEMVDAFCRSIWGEPATDTNREHVRRAITAALRVRNDEQALS